MNVKKVVSDGSAGRWGVSVCVCVCSVPDFVPCVRGSSILYAYVCISCVYYF